MLAAVSGNAAPYSFGATFEFQPFITNDKVMGNCTVSNSYK